MALVNYITKYRNVYEFNTSVLLISYCFGVGRLPDSIMRSEGYLDFIVSGNYFFQTMAHHKAMDAVYFCGISP
jgi:hypothetical protein